MEKKKRITIIGVAQELFARFGFVKTTVNEIAHAARMGKATLYHYFKGKEDIFTKVIEKERQILNEKIENALRREREPQKKLRAFFLTRMRYLEKLANITSALKDEFLKHHDFIEKIREEEFHREIEIVKDILKEGVDAGIFAIQNLRMTAFVILSAFKGLEYPWLKRMPYPEMEKNVDKMLEVVFKGISKK